MTDQINAFELRHYGVFDEPFDTIEGLAQYLLSPDQDAPAYVAIRMSVWECAELRRGVPSWMVELVEMVTNIPESRMLMVDCTSKAERFRVAVSILNAALGVITQADSDDGDIEEESGR